ncbi:MAG TPA: M28 family peptidase, partial [Hyphomonadaceae bacterium]|nr:M28 family peptidase [Hyphomonadaceae bacterium]
PSRWPDAYARSLSLRGAAPPTSAHLAVMRLSSDLLDEVIAGSSKDATAILASGAASRPLPVFDVPARLKATFKTSAFDLHSDNVLGLLPGTDPRLADEIVVVSAHLDGYGHGEAVDGDELYNGAFDDAAYVATLIRLAERRQGKGFRRPVLFAAFTGEEKGLLGSYWFTQNVTNPRQLAANINLDQLRPLFPLKILTVHAVNDTTLGDTAKAVATSMGIEIREDQEPERNLLTRSDHWPFLRIGVPATGFVFGFDNGTEAERRYREWYQVRYHRPQDDMGQPVDFKAALDMNTFFYRMTEAVADAVDRPAFKPDSQFKPR